MSRTVERDVKLDQKWTDIVVKRLAFAAILNGQVVSVGATSGVVIPCTNITMPFGVAFNGVTAVQIADYVAETRGEDTIEVIVALEGIAPVLGGEALDAGMWVSVDVNGRVIQATPGTQEVIGFTLSPCAGDGGAVTIFIQKTPAANYAP